MVTNMVRTRSFCKGKQMANKYVNCCFALIFYKVSEFDLPEIDKIWITTPLIRRNRAPPRDPDIDFKLSDARYEKGKRNKRTNN